MDCHRCSTAIDDGQERDLHGQLLCENCYMDALSPTRTCDPWAVHSAKTLSMAGGAGFEVTDVQARIIKIVEETGGAEFEPILERMEIDSSALLREIVALRHMEKVRWEKREGKPFCVLW
jgi:hypothetical protein